MSDPLALLPLAVAAGGGRLTDARGTYEAQQLVAAGLTLLQRSAPLVRALSGRRAAILLPTSPAVLVALAASEGRGAVLIDPLAAPAEVAFQLHDAGVGAVFTLSSLAGKLAGKLPADVPRVLLDGAPRSAQLLAGGVSREVDLGSHVGLAVEGERDVPGRDEEAAVVYTSAMRGIPLGASLTHRNLIANARGIAEAAALSPDDHMLALLPFAHLFGLTATGIAPLLAGARVTTMARFHPARAVAMLAGGGITAVVGVPAMYHALVAAIERTGRPLRGALRLAVCGGAPLPADLQERWHALTGTELREGYGLTEASPVCLFNRVDRPNRRGTVGVPLPGVEIAVCRPVAAGEAPGAPLEPLPTGSVGELCVRGEHVFRGYVARDADGLVRQDGWLRTGDLVAAGTDGSVTFHGVLKPMFTRNGYNIYPRELERVIGGLAGVSRVRVRGVPVPVHEHDIVVEVTGATSAAAVARWCREQLSAYKQPTRIVVTA